MQGWESFRMVPATCPTALGDHRGGDGHWGIYRQLTVSLDIKVPHTLLPLNHQGQEHLFKTRDAILSDHLQWAVHSALGALETFSDFLKTI